MAVVGRRARGVLGARSGSTSRSRRASRTSACSATREMPGAEWFPGARLSYAEHVFRGRDDDAVAILHASELRAARRVDVGRAARARRRASRAALRDCGRRRAATASPPTCRTSPRRSRRSSPARASARSGRAARRTSASRSVVDRFAQIEPKVLLAVDGYRYGGTRLRPRARSSRQLRRRAADARATVRAARTARAGGRLGRAARARRELEFAQLPFDHPLWVLYSLGHDRPAEGDRPRPGRHPARAPEEAAPAPRRAAPATGSSGSRRPAG